jgi:hypothetical protein
VSRRHAGDTPDQDRTCEDALVSPTTRPPHPLREVTPSILQGVLLDFWWDQERLWRLDLPVTEVPTRELRWHLELPMWALDDSPFTLTPAQVAACPRRYAGQYTRTLAADLRFPIHVLDRPERLTVLDGMHRLLKAHILGQDTVLAKKVPTSRLDDIVHR